MTPTPGEVHTDSKLLMTVYVGILAMICAFVAFYRIDWQSGLVAIIASEPAIFLAISLLVFLVIVFRIIRSYRLPETDHRAFNLTVALGIVTMLATFLCAEGAVRLLATSTPEGPSVMDTVLLPRDWPAVMANRRLLWEQSSSRYGVFRFDDMLGWTVGSNRQGTGPHGETYFSSREGLRTSGPDISLAGRATRAIALLGDSYVFASDVDYEDSWGHRLEQKLGPTVQVLNFGVPGYGIDQAYLRYERDVRAWHPEVVILALISHDVLRTTMVYYQVGFAGALVPGAKPRLTIRDGRLISINLPLPKPQALFQSHRIADVPFVDYDRSYRTSDWNWHFYQWSYLLRFAVSWAPSWRTPELDEETLTLNRVVLQTFVRRVQEDGAIPLILFLPSFTEYRDAGGRPHDRDLLGIRVLDHSDLAYVNALPCLDHLPSGQILFTTGWHYTPAANELIAQCLHAVIRQESIRARLGTEGSLPVYQ